MARQYTPEQREAQRARVRKHYAENKQYYKDKAAKQRRKTIDDLREYTSAYLEEQPCVDCGNDDQRVLEFDHVRGEKLFAISEAVRRQVSLTKLKTEIDKCEVRCANCHRIVTCERGGYHNSLGITE